MWIKDVLERSLGMFQRIAEPTSDEAIKGFLRVLERVRREDFSCSEAFARLDEYIEREIREKDAASLMPLLREHLELCAECREEYEALLNILENMAAATTQSAYRLRPAGLSNEAAGQANPRDEKRS